MNIRWRLGVLAVQLLVLATGTYLVTGRAYSAATWFMSGLLAVIINPQLLEPYYPRPADVAGNSLLALILSATATKSAATLGWTILEAALTMALLLGLSALLFGA